MSCRLYPALEIVWQATQDSEQIDRLLAALDDERPTAVEEREGGIAVFFPTAERRDRAAAIVRALAPDASVAAVSVSDGSWAERSQASLTPIRVGRIVVTPPWTRDNIAPALDDDVVITIVPSMGFGTGHHASTRLCLQLLQPWPTRVRSVLDVGTGSGVLAIAAWRLGAERVLGIDVDEDALASARENLDLNGASSAVELHAGDLADAPAALAGPFDLVLANLTGAMLERFARPLRALVAADGGLVVSGFQTAEEQDVINAFDISRLRAVRRAEEERWVAVQLAARAGS
jgi:ribosomal protein L11 methyltransferase